MTATAAGAALARAGVRDPARRNSPHDIARAGRCFRVSTTRGAVHVVFRRDGETLWFDGAASDDARGLSPLLSDIVQHVARLCGCARVRLETQRTAYLRIGARLGWRVAAVLPYARPAFVMEKEVAWT